MRRYTLSMGILCMLTACNSNRKQIEEPKGSEQNPAQGFQNPSSKAKATSAEAWGIAQNKQLDALFSLDRCPTFDNPVLQQLVSPESIKVFEDFPIAEFSTAVLEHHAHIRPQILQKNHCNDLVVSIGMHTFRLFRTIVEKREAFLKPFWGTESYLSRAKGIETSRESLATVMMGFVGSAMATVNPSLREEVFSLIQDERNFRAMNHAGRAFWIASVEQGFLVNPELSANYEQFRESVRIAKEVNASSQNDGVPLEIHNMMAGTPIGDGWFQVRSTKGEYSVELPLQAVDQTRGNPLYPSHEITGVALDVSGGKNPTLGTFRVICSRPIIEQSLEEMRASFEELGSSTLGSLVRDAPYKEHPGVQLLLPGQATVRSIKLPGKVCIIGVELAAPASLAPEVVERFINSFKTH